MLSIVTAKIKKTFKFHVKDSVMFFSKQEGKGGRGYQKGGEATAGIANGNFLCFQLTFEESSISRLKAGDPACQCRNMRLGDGKAE